MLSSCICVSLGAAAGTGDNTVSLNGSPAKGSFPTHSRARSCTSHLPSSTSEPVQTQQPCSLKGSLSSDNIYAGLHGDGTGTQVPPGQGTTHPDSTVLIKPLFVLLLCLIMLAMECLFFLPCCLFPLIMLLYRLV